MKRGKREFLDASDHADCNGDGLFDDLPAPIRRRLLGSEGRDCAEPGAGQNPRRADAQFFDCEESNDEDEDEDQEEIYWADAERVPGISPATSSSSKPEAICWDMFFKREPGSLPEEGESGRMRRQREEKERDLPSPELFTDPEEDGDSTSPRQPSSKSSSQSVRTWEPGSQGSLSEPERSQDGAGSLENAEPERGRGWQRRELWEGNRGGGKSGSCLPELSQDPPAQCGGLESHPKPDSQGSSDFDIPSTPESECSLPDQLRDLYCKLAAGEAVRTGGGQR